MRKVVSAALSTFALLVAAGAQGAAAPNTISEVDELRVVPVSGPFSVFWREDGKRVQNVHVPIASQNSVAREACVIGSLTGDSPNEVGYDVAPRGGEYAIAFSSTAIGKVHRGSVASGARCEGKPDATFEGPAPGVRLSQAATDTSRSMAYFGRAPNAFLTFVDVENLDGTHTTISGQIETVVPIHANPSFVGGQTALLLVPDATGLLAQTFDTTLGKALSAAPRVIVKGEIDRAVAFPGAGPEGGEGEAKFNVVYSTGGVLSEGFLQGEAFGSGPLFGDGVRRKLLDSTLDMGAGENALVVVFEELDQGRVFFARRRMLEGKAQPLLPSDKLELNLEGHGKGPVSVGCLDKVCVVAQNNGRGQIALRRVEGGKVESLPSAIVTVTVGGGGNGPYGGGRVPVQGDDDAARTDGASSSSGGCSVSSLNVHARTSSGLGACLIAVGLCAWGRRQRASSKRR